MSNSLLVINADGPETRVALVEDGFLGELYIERKRERGIAGNIYKGRVERVLPGHAGRLRQHRPREERLPARLGRPRHARRPEAALLGRVEPHRRRGRGGRRRRARAAAARASRTCSRKGRRSSSRSPRSPSAPRGARTTRYISLPGRHLVFMPTVDHVGISRRIASDKERKRLREIVESMRPPGSGFIVRTVADGTCPSASSSRTWSSSSSCGTRSCGAPRAAAARRSSTTTSTCCCARCATSSRPTSRS